MRTTQIQLASRPSGEPDQGNFRVRDSELPPLRINQVLLRVVYLSLDPYMRGRMDEADSYAASIRLGQTMVGGTVCEVVDSRAAEFRPGELVLSYSGWQTYDVADAAGLRKLDPKVAPVTTALGVLGMPGFTAYAGLLTIGRPQSNETVVVAAATGPVGSAVGQLARLAGARSVGIAGGPHKTAALTELFGFDAAIDHRADDFAERLDAECPNGIDVYFENVGGHVANAVYPKMNRFGRIPVCGLVADYNSSGHSHQGPDRRPAFLAKVLTSSLSVRGFIMDEFEGTHFDSFLRDMVPWVRDGRIRYQEDVVTGLSSAPDAFRDMLRGNRFGKVIVKVSDL